MSGPRVRENLWSAFKMTPLELAHGTERLGSTIIHFVLPGGGTVLVCDMPRVVVLAGSERLVFPRDCLLLALSAESPGPSKTGHTLTDEQSSCGCAVAE